MKLIQAGIGGMGNTWLKAVLASKRVEHAAFVEVSEAVIEEQVEQHGIDRALVFPTLEEAMDAVEADAVLIVTPPAFHKTMSFAALERGLPVLSEKPLADTLADAQAIVDKANETGVLHMVAQNYRYTEQAQTVKQVLRSGELGQSGDGGGRVLQRHHPARLPPTTALPLLIDMVIHHFDMMRFFLDADPQAISGRSWNPAWSWFRGDASTTILLDFPDDIVVTYTGSWVTTALDTSWNANWRFECERGVLLLHDDEVILQRRTDEVGSPKHYPQYLTEAVEPVPLVEMQRDRQDYLLHEFYEAVMHGKSPATTCQDNIKSYRMVWDAIASFEMNQRGVLTGAGVTSRLE